tara:strand:+ start:24 stop:329 length:306 start_codon:yes stop_codon:yes gene_type:complete
MSTKSILFALVTVIILGVILYYTIFKESEEPEPEIVISEEIKKEIEEEVESSPDVIDDVMTGGGGDPIPDEDETSLETAPAEAEAEAEVEDVTVEGYMLKK